LDKMDGLGIGEISGHFTPPRLIELTAVKLAHSL